MVNCIVPGRNFVHKTPFKPVCYKECCFNNLHAICMQFSWIIIVFRKCDNLLIYTFTSQNEYSETY